MHTKHVVRTCCKGAAYKSTIPSAEKPAIKDGPGLDFFINRYPKFSLFTAYLLYII